MYLEKQLKDTKIFEFFTFDKMISHQSMFVSDRTHTVQPDSFSTLDPVVGRIYVQCKY